MRSTSITVKDLSVDTILLIDAMAQGMATHRLQNHYGLVLRHLGEGLHHRLQTAAANTFGKKGKGKFRFGIADAQCVYSNRHIVHEAIIPGYRNETKQQYLTAEFNRICGELERFLDREMRLAQARFDKEAEHA